MVHHRSSLALLLAILLGTPARADFVVTISDASVPMGGTGFVDVLISSNNGPTGDKLNSFSFDFQITTSGSTRLEFVNPQPDTQLTNSNYVFFGDSLDQKTSTPVGNVTSTTVHNDTFIGGDSTFSGSDVTVTGNQLLAQLEVTANPTQGTAPQVGDTFAISFVPSSAIAANQGGNNFFANSSQPNPPPGSVNYSSTAGTVSISASLTPEPGSLALAGLASVATALYGAHCRRRKHTEESILVPSPLAGEDEGGG